MPTSQTKKRPAPGPVVTKGLRRVLVVVLVLFALLLIDSAYLGAIDLVQWWTGRSIENAGYIWAFLAHLVLGLLITVPVIYYGIKHALRSYHRPNRRAVAVGWALLVTAVGLLVTGYLLARVRIGGFEIGIGDSATRDLVFWIHVALPFVAIWFFILHRLVGPRLRWRSGVVTGLVATSIAMVAVVWHLPPPKAARGVGIHSGSIIATAVSDNELFAPSLVQTESGETIDPEHLLVNEQCQACHPDSHSTWASSVHHFSSFNNPIYAFSVRNTRDAMVERTGSVKPARFCAGCHDPVVLMTGAYDEERWSDREYDAASDPLGSAGINCVVCHGIVDVSPLGNASYTFKDPARYPFAHSDNTFLQWVNRQLIKAKPAFHKRTFLKPLHSTSEFCGTCHKVFLPEELNGYKFLPGQNHYDTWRLSGVSGRGITAWYFPQTIQSNCNGCHMQLMPSNSIAARDRDGSGIPTVHGHGFHAANAAIAPLVGDPNADEVLEACERFNDDALRVDLFALRKGGSIDGELMGPIRPIIPVVERGETYLLETFVRTLKLGHPFTQGTADSNEVWIELRMLSGDRVLAESGGIDEDGVVDPWAKFLNVWLLDREGRRIEQRNPEDIFVPLYNHQIPPGAAELTHYSMTIPPDAGDEIRLEARVRYRKFDSRLIGHVYGRAADAALDEIPIIDLASDSVTLPVGQAREGVESVDEPFPAWGRWNDYGISLVRASGRGGAAKGQLRQAAEAFEMVEELGRVEGAVNLARTLLREGRIDDAGLALSRAAADPNLDRPWSVDWFSAQVERERGALDEAIVRLERVIDSRYPVAIERGYDFGRDERVLLELANTLFERSRLERGEVRDEMLRRVQSLCERGLEMNPQRAGIWYTLSRAAEVMGDEKLATQARNQFDLLRPDDNAADQAIQLARRNDPVANHAAEPIAIYDLNADPKVGQVLQGDTDE